MIRQLGVKRGKIMGIKHPDLSPHGLKDALGLEGEAARAGVGTQRAIQGKDSWPVSDRLNGLELLEGRSGWVGNH